MSKPIPLPPEHLDKWFKEGLLELEEYNYIQGVDELIDLLKYYRNSEKLKILSEFNIGRNIFNPNTKNIEIIKNAKKELGGLINFNASQMDFYGFNSLNVIIIYSIMSEFNKILSDDEIDQILHSNLISKLIFSQEKFIVPNENIKLDGQYFKQLRKIKFRKQEKKLHKLIYIDIWCKVTDIFLIDNFKTVKFGMCSDFLSGCYAFSEGRGEVNLEDVVKAWILTLKLFDMDLRHYIFEE